MALITNIVVLTIALATIANAALLASTMTNTVTLAIGFTAAFATVATAKLQNFTYMGIETNENDGCDESHFCYSVTDDTGGEPRLGSVHGCLRAQWDHNIDNGGFEFALFQDLDLTAHRYVASLKELSTGDMVYAAEYVLHNTAPPEITKPHPNARTFVGHTLGFDGTRTLDDFPCEARWTGKPSA